MKGFIEVRGQAFKLEFDSASGQFVSKPIAHAFTSMPAPRSNGDEVAALRKPKSRKKAKRNLAGVLPKSTPEVGDDIVVIRELSASGLC
jgi:hypothetical protein